MANARNPSVCISDGFQSIGVWKTACRAIFGSCVHNFSARANIQNKLLHPDYHLVFQEVWTKQFSKGTNIGFNNLHSSLDFGDSVLMPKLAKKSEFDVPANIGWMKMET
jgi:hypothetical protein